MRIRRASLAVALAVACCAAAAAPASAQSSGLEDAQETLQGERGLLEFLAGRLCPTVEGVGETVNGVPLVDPVVDTAASLICNAALLEFNFRTEYTKADGTVVARNHTATLNVPRPLNLDGDILPEATGTVVLVSPDRLAIRVDKLPLAETRLPAQVELIVRDPRNVRSDSRIAFGYDSRPATVPHTWSTTLFLRSLSQPYRLGAQVAQTGAGDRLALIGELFEKRPDDGRATKLAARLGFAPVPTALNAELTFGDDQQKVTLTSDRRPVVDGLVRLVDGDQETRIDARIDRLPSRVDVALDGSGENQAVAYSAAEPISALDVTYQALKGAALQSKAVVEVDDLPRGVTFRRTGALAGRVTTQGGPVGSITAAFAPGEVEPYTGDESGVQVRTRGAKTFVAARLDGLSAAEFDAEEPYLVDITSKQQPFSLLVDDEDAKRTITGRITDLPEHMRLSYDASQGKLGFNGFGQGIGEIAVVAEDDTPLFGRIKKVSGWVRDVPAQFDLTYDAPQGGPLSVVSTQPLGELELRGGENVLLPGPIPAGESGIHYVDVPDGQAVHAKVQGLKSVVYNGDPIEARVRTAGPTKLNLDAQVQAAGAPRPVGIRGFVDKVPGEVDVVVGNDGSGGKNITYRASDRIDKIKLSTSGIAIGRADTLEGTITGMPKELHVAVPASGDLLRFGTGGHAIDNVEFQAHDGTPVQFRQASGQFSPEVDGFTYIDRPTRYGIGVRLSGLRGASARLDPSPKIGLDVDPAKAQQFGVSVERQSFGLPLEYLRGYVERPVPQMSLELDQSAGTKLKYSAGAPLDVIFLEGNLGMPFLRATLSDLPTRLDVCFGTQDEPHCLRQPFPANVPVDGERKVQLDIDDHGTTPDARPVRIDAFLCLKQARRGACESADVMNNKDVRTYAIIRNMRIHNVFVDLNADTCSLVRLCGHITMDTRDREFTGQIDYQDRDATEHLDRIFARMTFPPGFRAAFRHARWHEEPIGPGGSADDPVLNGVTCPDGTAIQVATDPLGPVDNLTVVADFGGKYLCKSPQRP